MNSDKWRIKKQKTWDILVECAKRRDFITYGELGKMVNVIAVNVGVHLLMPILQYCNTNDLPPLTVIVINKLTRKANYEQGVNVILERDGKKPISRHEESEIILKVHNFDWTSIINPFIDKNSKIEKAVQVILSGNSSDSVEEIIALEKKMRNQIPEVKQRISSFIERGAIANKVKVLTKHKCLVCEALGQSPFSFKKKNGDYYVETHHVEQVSNLTKGSLGIKNLITVCANHHRQMHYGNCELVDESETEFKFNIDGIDIIIKKISVC